MRYIQTPKDSPALVDAIIVSNKIEGVVETKCRYGLTLSQFNESYNSEWLVTWSKVQEGMKIAAGLRVPFVGFLYLVDSGHVLMQRITQPDGRLVVDIRLSTTETQASINGGKAMRTNAFIDMKLANVYKKEPNDR